MIGEKNDRCVLQHLSSVKRLQDAPDLLIDEADRAIVALPRSSGFSVIQFAVPDLVIRSASLFISLGPEACERLWQMGILVHLEKALGRIVRAMRAYEGNFEEEWLRPVVVT
jgi:hypothetical protein